MHRSGTQLWLLPKFGLGSASIQVGNQWRHNGD